MQEVPWYRVFRRTLPAFFALAAVAAFGVSSGRLVSPELLEHASLKIVWENELPIKPGESLKRLYIIDEQLYAFSDRNYLISLDRNRGTITFGRSIAPLGVLVGDMVPFEGELMAAFGSRLMTIDPRTGRESDVASFDYGISCPPGRNEALLYVAGADRRLHVMHAKNKVQIFEVSPDNKSMITSLLADERSVIFGTDAGNVVCMAPNAARRMWQFDASKGVVGPLIMDGQSLFLASKDLNVYRIDVVGATGIDLVWKTQVVGVPESEPRVTRTIVYQRLRGKGVTAIDKQAGTVLWTLPAAAELLAETAGRAYLMTHNRTLSVMDNNTGKKLYSVNFALVNRCAVNVVDGKMYIGDENGRVACLEPVR